MLAQNALYADLYAAPLIEHRRVRLYLTASQARAYAHRLPARLTSRVGSPLPEVTTPLTTPRRMMLERGAHSNWAKKRSSSRGVLEDLWGHWLV
jgi:hypothetical protein